MGFEPLQCNILRFRIQTFCSFLFDFKKVDRLLVILSKCVEKNQMRLQNIKTFTYQYLDIFMFDCIFEF